MRNFAVIGRMSAKAGGQKTSFLTLAYCWNFAACSSVQRAVSLDDARVTRQASTMTFQMAEVAIIAPIEWAILTAILNQNE